MLFCCHGPADSIFSFFAVVCCLPSSLFVMTSESIPLGHNLSVHTYIYRLPSSPPSLPPCCHGRPGQPPCRLFYEALPNQPTHQPSNMKKPSLIKRRRTSLWWCSSTTHNYTHIANPCYIHIHTHIETETYTQPASQHSHVCDTFRV